MGGKVAFKRRVQLLLKSLPRRGLTVQALGEALQSFLAGLHDGHTRLQLQSFSWKTPGDVVPVLFEVSDRGLHIAAFDLATLVEKLDGLAAQLVGRSGGPDGVSVVGIDFSVRPQSASLWPPTGSPEQPARPRGPSRFTPDLAGSP